MTNDPLFLKQGYLMLDLKLPKQLDQWVEQKEWSEVDQWLFSETKPTGMIGSQIAKHLSSYDCEHIISIRQQPDEDGIWHDDGSRDLAFSLSLNKDPSLIQGGALSLRNKEDRENEIQLQTQPWGRLIFFLTGKQGFEHKTCEVLRGQRIVAAGWATERSS